MHMVSEPQINHAFKKYLLRGIICFFSALVQYLLTAKLVPTGDPDVEAAPTRFSVTPAVALDSMEAPIPPSAPAQERRKFPGACSCLGGEVQANAHLQKRAFVSGEAANVALSVRNGWGNPNYYLFCIYVQL